MSHSANVLLSSCLLLSPPLNSQSLGSTILYCTVVGYIARRRKEEKRGNKDDTMRTKLMVRTDMAFQLALFVVWHCGQRISFGIRICCYYHKPNCAQF